MLYDNCVYMDVMVVHRLLCDTYCRHRFCFTLLLVIILSTIRIHAASTLWSWKGKMQTLE